jgi:hypothetical protein
MNWQCNKLAICVLITGLVAVSGCSNILGRILSHLGPPMTEPVWVTTLLSWRYEFDKKHLSVTVGLTYPELNWARYKFYRLGGGASLMRSPDASGPGLIDIYIIVTKHERNLFDPFQEREKANLPSEQAMGLEEITPGEYTIRTRTADGQIKVLDTLTLEANTGHD